MSLLLPSRFKVKKRTRGFFIWKQRWYSFCSIHQQYQPDCKLCNAGAWNNVLGVAVSSFFYKHFYKMWLWWANRPKRKAKWLKKTQEYFPNLKH